MASYEELRVEFERKVKELQARCKHERVSGWETEYWALGHPTQFEIKYCLICNLILERRTKCSVCQEYVSDNEWVDGASYEAGGRVVGFFRYMHRACFDALDKKIRAGDALTDPDLFFKRLHHYVEELRRARTSTTDTP
jgi:hypothetical protein